MFSFTGKPATDELRLSALELKLNFKLMMVGSLEADIDGVCNVQFDNRDVIDDFDDDNADGKTPHQFHKMEVRSELIDRGERNTFILSHYLAIYFNFVPQRAIV